ncbi:MAG: hypothetical protein HY063_02665 [Bacteroidetes bacterium]|nr:hypothetical protein [Bacteroidota bacterium]
MDKNSNVLIGLLAVAGGLFYVGSELNKSRKVRETAVKSKGKKKHSKNEFENRTIAGFKQIPLKG